MPYEFLLDEDESACGALIAYMTGAGGRDGVVLFLGAGISAQLGFPTWTELVGSLVKSAGLAEQFPVSNLEKAEVPLPDIAESCWKSLCELGREGEYWQVLKEAFAHVAPDSVKVHEYMLSAGFRSFLTTNYDASLDHAHRHRMSTAMQYLTEFPVWRQGEFNPGLLEDPHRRVYYLHGRCHDRYGEDQTSTLVLKRSDYRTAYSFMRRRNAGTFMAAALRRRVFLFAGCSLRDPPIHTLLLKYRKWAERRAPDRRHFALVSVAETNGVGAGDKGETHQDSEDLLDSLWVVPLRYRRSTGKEEHARLLQFFLQLAKRVPYSGVPRTPNEGYGGPRP